MFKWWLVFALLFGVAFLRTYLSYRSYWIYPGGIFRALLIKPPQLRGAYQTLEVRPGGLSKTFKVTTRAYPDFRYGDLLEVTHKTSEVEPETSEVERRGSNLSFPAIKIIERDRGNLILKHLYQLREQLLVRIDKILPEPHASLLAGIVFGIERDLGKGLNQAFREAGLVHIIVASGFNVTIVIGYLAKFLKVVGRKLGFGLMILGVLIYAAMAGFDPPIVRAIIMGLATLLAVVVGRRKQALLWLFFTAVIMLIWQPLLYQSLSFQLSFAATLAILFFQERLQKWFYFFPKLVRSDVATTLAVQIFILPLIWWQLGQIQPASILVNTLTLWTIEFLMPLGMLASLVAFVNIFAALLIALPAQLMLSYVLWIVAIFT